VSIQKLKCKERLFCVVMLICQLKCKERLFCVIMLISQLQIYLYHLCCRHLSVYLRNLSIPFLYFLPSPVRNIFSTNPQFRCINLFPLLFTSASKLYITLVWLVQTCLLEIWSNKKEVMYFSFLKMKLEISSLFITEYSGPTFYSLRSLFQLLVLPITEDPKHTY